MKIKSIKIEIAGEDKELSLDEARELRNFLNKLLADEAPARPTQYPPVVVPYVQAMDACNDGGAHDFPMFQVGTVACQKCGKVSAAPLSWTTTTSSNVSSTSSSGGIFFATAKKGEPS